MPIAKSEPAPNSIYASAAPVRADREARQARRRRLEARLEPRRLDRPHLHLDRLGPVEVMLRRYREGAGASCPSPLEARLLELEAEVASLEAWVRALPEAALREGAAIRRALDLLRGFGHLTTLDYSPIPVEERPALVALLALEHRWCYAAAGTEREVFKLVTGRTGAR